MEGEDSGNANSSTKKQRREDEPASGASGASTTASGESKEGTGADARQAELGSGPTAAASGGGGGGERNGTDLELMRLREENRRLLMLQQGRSANETDPLAVVSPLANIPTSQLLSLFPRSGLPSGFGGLGAGVGGSSSSDRLLSAQAALARERAQNHDPPGNRFEGLSGSDPFLGTMPSGMGAGVGMSSSGLGAAAAAMQASMRPGLSIEQMIGLDRQMTGGVGAHYIPGSTNGLPGDLMNGTLFSPNIADSNDLRILTAYLAGRDHEQQHQLRQRAVMGLVDTAISATPAAAASSVSAAQENSRKPAAKRPHSETVSSAFKPAAEAAPLGPPPKFRKVDPVPLYNPSDNEDLSEYQILVRKQIEAFQADEEDTRTSTRGRNRPIVKGQVGIRCRHCKVIPPQHRQRASIYYPSKLERLYQMSQTIASLHLAEHCQHIPTEIRNELSKLREAKSAALGGKKYWADTGAAMGLVEHDKRLFYTEKPAKKTKSS